MKYCEIHTLCKPDTGKPKLVVELESSIKDTISNFVSLTEIVQITMEHLQSLAGKMFNAIILFLIIVNTFSVFLFCF